MNYSETIVVLRKKAREYTLAQCEYAIRDINKAIALHEGDLNHPYIQQLWAELDAVIERYRKLSKPLYLIACSAAKLDRPAPAAQLYTGQAFKMAMAAAQRAGADVLILSALHGAVDPAQVIAPYNCTLATMKKYDRLKWEIKTWADLHPHNGRAITVLAGKRYAAALAGFPNVSLPLAGLGIGQQLAALKTLNA
jgi:hypothetical protein